MSSPETKDPEPQNLPGAFSSLEDLALEDTADVIVVFGGKPVRFGVHEHPWTVRLMRLQVPSMRAFYDSCAKRNAAGTLSEEDFFVQILTKAVQGWSYGPETFTTNAVMRIVTDPKFSWIRKQWMDRLLDDQTFSKGT